MNTTALTRRHPLFRTDIIPVDSLMTLFIINERPPVYTPSASSLYTSSSLIHLNLQPPSTVLQLLGSISQHLYSASIFSFPLSFPSPSLPPSLSHLLRPLLCYIILMSFSRQHSLYNTHQAITRLWHIGLIYLPRWIFSGSFQLYEEIIIQSFEKVLSFSTSISQSFLAQCVRVICVLSHPVSYRLPVFSLSSALSSHFALCTHSISSLFLIILSPVAKNPVSRIVRSK